MRRWTESRVRHGRRRWLRGAGAAALLAALAVAGGVAHGTVVSGPRETVSSEFTSTHVHSPTGSVYDVTYHNPTDPSKNPPAVRRVVLTRPPGTRVDTSVPARCHATDMQFQLYGDAACPSKSKIGSGTVTVSVLGGPPSTSQVSVFNTAHGLVQLVKFQSFGAGVARSTYHGDVVDTKIPTCLTGGQPPKGCPFDQAVLLASKIVLPKFIDDGRSYNVTPSRCPAGGWPTKLTYHYADGAVESLVSRSKCTAPPKRCHARDRDRDDDDVDGAESDRDRDPRCVRGREARHSVGSRP